MDTRVGIILGITIAYFVVMSYIGFSVRKHAKSSDGFTGGGRSFPPFLIAALMLSEFIGSSGSCRIQSSVRFYPFRYKPLEETNTSRVRESTCLLPCARA
ncbi:hypothetical protein [Pseudomonas sp.]|uniref:hypothetical protein n=1 Tax=Pseudomonas sp. TaxID=306 RepID=UPI002606A5D9|nr:hypothetical protein [Pseudomonas sp.]